MDSVYPSDTDESEAEALAASWAARVAANREQAERLREESDGGDHYRPLAAAFRADPRRSDDPALEALLSLSRPDDVWIDVGAGAGRFTLPLALHVKHALAIEPSPAMRSELAQLQTEYGIFNVDVRDQRWPSDDPALTDIADVALISHVGYDIEPIAAFLDTLDRAARRECVALTFDRAPGSLFWQAWPMVHGEEHVQLPGGAELVALLRARGAEVAVSAIAGTTRVRWSFDSFDEAMEWARRRLWLSEASEKLPRLRAAVTAILVEEDGRWSLPERPTQQLIRWRIP